MQKIQKLIQTLVVKILRERDVSPVFDGVPVASAAVADPRGFLPVVMRQALCTGMALPSIEKHVFFGECDDSPVQERVKVYDWPEGWMLLPLVHHSLEMAQVRSPKGVLDLHKIYPPIPMQKQIGGLVIDKFEELVPYQKSVGMDQEGV